MVYFKDFILPRRAPCGRRLDIVAAVSVLLFAFGTFAGEPAGQKVFSSPGLAATALVAAANSDDMNALESILGADAKEVLSSGDPVADNNAREMFVAKYQEMHRLAYDDLDRVILYLGADNWPFPIPLVKRGEGWLFDTAAGEQELLHRRIGRNELFTIGVLEDLAAAQEEYASEKRDGEPVRQFAQKIQSDPGRHNGLYWPRAGDELESPIGPLIAGAKVAGYKTGNTAPIPFHGYYYKILTRQGPNAPGGARNYIVRGRMTKGFAFLAYPADYRASGVMTFMIDQDGVIVQKDLGPETTKRASEIAEFNPDKTWDQDITDAEVQPDDDEAG
jgi:hypothetical protein